MRILSVNLDPSPNLNLGPIQMDKLGQTVVIAGKNGAGKSRLLGLIHQEASNRPSVENLENQLRTYEQALRNSREQMQRDSFTKNLETLKEQLRRAAMLELTEERRPQVVPFVPKKLTLQDPNSQSPAVNQQHATATESPGITKLDQGTFARIQILQNRNWEATHPSSTIDKVTADIARAQYKNIEDLVRKFLGTEISRSVDGQAELFGLPLGKSNLSDGQKVILQLCVAIHAQGASLSDVIIFMDESENHLHPAALLEMIEAVQRHLTNGQMWIATHSVPLLANMPPSAIWWMEDNTVTKAGDKPEKVLEGLLGGEERRGNLATFLDLPFALASNRFAAECMISPLTVPHRSGDPQAQQILDVLSSLTHESEALRILDLGAGKGRLAAELAELVGGHGTMEIDYIAFDPDPKDAEECKAAIQRLGLEPAERYFNEWNALRGRYDEGSFDVVVMCNVLHEIAPAQWSGIFGETGKVSKLLRATGFLLLVEVQQLPYGERAHEFGFLVLDTAQLRKLFSISEGDMSGFITDSRRDGWLKAHLVSQSLLERYTHQTLQAALDDIAETAREKISSLREQGRVDYRSGRLHGFWVQQFANAMLAKD